MAGISQIVGIPGKDQVNAAVVTGISSLIPYPKMISDIAVPVIGLERIRQAVLIRQLTVNIAAGAVTLYTCPEGRQASIRFLHKGVTANTTQFLLTGYHEDLPTYPLQAAALVLSLNDIPLPPGGKLKISQGGAGDVAVLMGFVVVEFES